MANILNESDATSGMDSDIDIEDLIQEVSRLKADMEADLMGVSAALSENGNLLRRDTNFSDSEDDISIEENQLISHSFPDFGEIPAEITKLGGKGSTQEFLLTLYILMFRNVFENALKLFWPLNDDNDQYEDVRRTMLSVLFSDNQENLKELLGEDFAMNAETMKEEVKTAVMDAWKAQRNDVLNNNDVLTHAVQCGMTLQVSKEFADDFSLTSAYPLEDVLTWCEVIPLVTNDLEWLTCNLEEGDSRRRSLIIKNVSRMKRSTDVLWLKIDKLHAIEHQNDLIILLKSLTINKKLLISLMSKSTENPIHSEDIIESIQDEIKDICRRKQLKIEFMI